MRGTNFTATPLFEGQVIAFKSPHADVTLYDIARFNTKYNCLEWWALNDPTPEQILYSLSKSSADNFFHSQRNHLMKLNAIQKAQAFESCNIMQNQGSFAFYLAQAFTRADQVNAYKLFTAFPELFTQAPVTEESH